MIYQLSILEVSKTWLFHLELERKNIKYLSIIQMLIGMLLGLAIQIKSESFMLLEGLIFGGIWGLTTPFWIKIAKLVENLSKNIL